jgi:hypothetical protein
MKSYNFLTRSSHDLMTLSWEQENSDCFTAATNTIAATGYSFNMAYSAKFEGPRFIIMSRAVVSFKATLVNSKVLFNTRHPQH